MRTAIAMPDEREKKLPVWAREKLYGLRQELESSVRHADFVEEENARLRAVIEGRFTGKPEDDTFLINDDTAKELPLGKGPEIRFADFYTVRYGDARTSGGGATANLIGGARVLVVETDKPMQLRPTLDPCVIIVAAAP
jgi:hypothetical protein